MAGRRGHRAVLPPSGHAAVDEARIALVADVGAEPQPFHDSRTEALLQHVGLLDHGEERVDAGRILEVYGDRLAASVQEVELGAASRHALTIDADHVGSHVGEHHGAERSRSDAGDLDDLYAVEGAHIRLLAAVVDSAASAVGPRS